MIIQKKSISLLIAALAIIAGTAMTGLTNQSQNTSNSPASEKVKEDFHTVADYLAPLPSDPQLRAIRLVRSQRFNLLKVNPPGDDARRFMLTEQRDSSFGRFPSHALAEPALPVLQSDTVVVGEVTDAQAYLSVDKANIYSEFTVRVNDVLKNNSAVPLSIGDSIITIRGGGAVRFPSGKIIRVGFIGKPLPRSGRQYLFFLNNNEEGQDFSVVTGYEMGAGGVTPLDGIAFDGSIIEELSAHQTYNGVDEAIFLKEVREAIARASEDKLQ